MIDLLSSYLCEKGYSSHFFCTYEGHFICFYSYFFFYWWNILVSTKKRIYKFKKWKVILDELKMFIFLITRYICCVNIGIMGTFGTCPLSIPSHMIYMGMSPSLEFCLLYVRIAWLAERTSVFPSSFATIFLLLLLHFIINAIIETCFRFHILGSLLVYHT